MPDRAASTKKALGFLRELCDAVLLHLRALGAEMQAPADADRGRRIAAIANRLEWANDRCRYFGLGIDFRSDPESKTREAALAEYLDPWIERAACAEVVRAEIGKWSNLSPQAVDEVLERIAAAIEARAPVLGSRRA